ncbi:MAG: ATP-binding protein, partial [Verrucomicrobiota bacterium]
MDSTSPEMRQEYREVDHKRRVLASKITHVVTFFFVPAGSVLDYFVYPEHFVSFLILRLTAACIIALLFALHFTKTGRKYIVALPLALGLITAGCICWMISATEGHASPYYGGLNLVILGFTVLLPWTYQETSILGAGTLLMYLAACLLDSPTPIPYNASFFILLTTIACAVSSYYTSTARFQDFLLRHELDVRNKKLEEMDQLKSRFFANISHEFRTPLTLILSPVDDLLRNNQNLPTHVQDTLLLVSNNALRLLKLINDLLETMRLEESSLQEDDTFVDLATFLPGICDSIRHLTQKKKIKLIVEGEKGPILVNGDPNRLEKVFLNLLTNAVKFTPEGGSIKVQWTRENEEVLINITDTGIGIPEGELSKIFDRFHQVDGSSKRRHQG